CECYQPDESLRRSMPGSRGIANRRPHDTRERRSEWPETRTTLRDDGAMRLASETTAGGPRLRSAADGVEERWEGAEQAERDQNGLTSSCLHNYVSTRDRIVRDGSAAGLLLGAHLAAVTSSASP